MLAFRVLRKWPGSGITGRETAWHGLARERDLPFHLVKGRKPQRHTRN
jgi:hypothetical protein